MKVGSKKIYHNYVGLIIGLLIGTLVIELGFRLVENTPLWKVLPVAEISLFKPDYYSGYRLRKNVEGIWATENRSKIKISSIGLRDDEINFSNKDKLRVLMVGDSIAEALQVDIKDTFQSLIEKKISSLDVINLSMSGAIPSVQIALMKHYGQGFNADAMLYVVDASDFDKMEASIETSYPFYKLNNGNYVLDYSFRNTKGYQFRTSKVGELIYWALSHFRVALMLNSRKNRGLLDDAQVNYPNVINNKLCNDSAQKNINNKWNSQKSPDIRTTFLEDIQIIGEKNNAKVILALRNIHSCIDENSYELHSRVEETLSKYGVIFVDIDMELYQLEKQYPDKYPYNKLRGFKSSIGYGHLNKKGHEAYAEILKNKLQEVLHIK